MDRRFMFIKNDPMGLSAPAPGLYSCIHTYDINILTSSLKPLGQCKPNFILSIVRQGNEILNKRSRAHDQMATMAINSKNV